MVKEALWAPAELCGHLQKFGPRTCTWRRRFVALRGSNLFYFRGAGSSRPLGVIPLEGAVVAAEQLLVPAAGPLGGRAPRVLHTLQVALAPEAAARHPHRAYLLAAPTPELQELWLNALVEASLPRGLLLTAAQEAVDSRAAGMEQPRSSAYLAAAGPQAARQSHMHAAKAQAAAPPGDQAATWQEWQQQMRPPQVGGGRSSVVQQLLPRASQPAAELEAASGQLQRLSQAGLEAATAAAMAEPGAHQPSGGGADALVPATGPLIGHLQLKQLKQLARAPRRKHWSCCWGLCQVSDDDAPSSAGGAESDGKGSHAGYGGGAASAAASESTCASQTTQQWAARSMSVAQTAKLRQSMMQRTSGAGFGILEGGGPTLEQAPGEEPGEAGAGGGLLESLNLRPALTSGAAVPGRRESTGGDERWRRAAQPALAMASLSGARGGIAPLPAAGGAARASARGHRGSVSDGGAAAAAAPRSSRRPAASTAQWAARGAGDEADRAARASVRGRTSYLPLRERGGHAAAEAGREPASRPDYASGGGGGRVDALDAAAADGAGFGGGGDDALSLITTFDDDVDATAAAGWRVAPGRYTRGNSGWLDFVAPHHERGSGDARSTSSGFLSDFGSKEGAAPGWASAGDGDQRPRQRERPTVGGGSGGGGGGGGGWAAGASGGCGGAAAWGAKAAPSQRRSVRQRGDDAGTGVDASDAFALRRQLEAQQRQIDALTTLLVPQLQQPPRVEAAPPAEAPAPPPHSAARASALEGRTFSVQSMVANLQRPGAQRRSDPAAEAGGAAVAAPRARRSSRGSTGGAAGCVAAAAPATAGAGPLAEYDAVSRELRGQFLERLRGPQPPPDQMAQGALGGGAAEAWGHTAGVPGSEHGSGADGALSGSSGSFALDGGGPLAPGAEASAGSILAAVEQLRGSMVQLQQQLGLPPADAGAAGLGPSPHPESRASPARRGAAPPPPPPPVPPPMFSPAAPTARQPRASGTGSATPLAGARAARPSQAAPHAPDANSARARLLREVAAGGGGGVALRHVERPSQVARAAAGRY